MNWKELESSIAKDYANTAGIVVRKNGETLYEGYFHGNSPEDAFHVFSVTKSVVSALFGIAIGQGWIQSVDQPALSFFPEYRARSGNRTAAHVTIRHLLTMTAPFQYEAEPYEEYFRSGDRMRTALGYLGGEEPGMFRYSPFLSAHILSGILANATGRSALDFAAENLFAPLGISAPEPVLLRGEPAYWGWYEKPRHKPGWVTEPQGINPGGWGLCLTPTAMAKIGQLCLNGGLWQGKRIIPARWIQESTREQSRREEIGLGYGYLWWIPEGGQIFAAIGDGGSIIYANRETGLVAAIACRSDPAAKDRLGLIRDVIEPCAAAASRPARNPPGRT